MDTVEGLLLLSSSVDLRSDNTCIPATGAWSGKSFNPKPQGDTLFETCFQNVYTKEECFGPNLTLLVMPGSNVTGRGGALIGSGLIQAQQLQPVDLLVNSSHMVLMMVWGLDDDEYSNCSLY